jgi:hypothetical protein
VDKLQVPPVAAVATPGTAVKQAMAADTDYRNKHGQSEAAPFSPPRMGSLDAGGVPATTTSVSYTTTAATAAAASSSNHFNDSVDRQTNAVVLGRLADGTFGLQLAGGVETDKLVTLVSVAGLKVVSASCGAPLSGDALVAVNGINVAGESLARTKQLLALDGQTVELVLLSDLGGNGRIGSGALVAIDAVTIASPSPGIFSRSLKSFLSFWIFI